jgi:hypothetical protein
MSCSPLKIRRHFGGTASKIKTKKKPAWTQVASGARRPKRWRWHILPKRRLTFNGIHGTIFHNLGCENLRTYLCYLYITQGYVSASMWLVEVMLSGLMSSINWSNSNCVPKSNAYVSIAEWFWSEHSFDYFRPIPFPGIRLIITSKKIIESYIMQSNNTV